jgi:hypothetical protein
MTMRGNANKIIVGVFHYMDDLLKNIESVKHGGYEYKVYSPMARHEIEHATHPEKSPIRRFTLVGGVFGCIAGWSLAILCSLDWPLRVSAKDIVSPPGFFVVGYEWTILFAALATFLGLLHFCRIPDIFRKVGYDPRFSDNKFGLVVSANSGDAEAIKKHLLENGAEEAEIKDAL